ncbi:hypothetical protein A8924_7075 [Saccharopolyspora erythraea NRRL 2338]|uniref:hypothetical protein n=1 Tax=Saccharopolyspora erythraea TaxID=1836 RepID=UPI000C01B114|nr:hypothetical protein [Saccharopolyspora erythraea]PFG99526.1 hypothetical protein A8924_7075 [Saccharopolyspora erythraea NRRL 2338]
MRSVIRRTATGLIGASLALTAVVTAPATAAGRETAAIKCNDSGEGGRAFYHGPSAGDVYDGKFRQGNPIPGLSEGYVPQGLGAWKNWDGAGHDMMLVSMYMDGYKGRVYGIEAGTSKVFGPVDIRSAHAGGVAVVKGWVFVPGDNNRSMNKYKAADLAAKFKAGGRQTLAPNGPAQKVGGASFLTGYGGVLYTGHFDEDRMYTYAVNGATGRLEKTATYKTPDKTQGVMVTRTHFVYSTSYGRKNPSNIHVVARGKNIDHRSAKCFQAPSMSEGIADYEGTAWLLYESGATGQYPGARNVIKHLHWARTADLPKFTAG